MPVKNRDLEKYGCVYIYIYIYKTHIDIYIHVKENGTASKSKINACKFKIAVKS